LRCAALRTARRVSVRLDDTNGARRGVDSRCSLTLHMRDGRHIDAEAVTAWQYASITLSAKRLNEALRRDSTRPSYLSVAVAEAGSTPRNDSVSPWRVTMDTHPTRLHSMKGHLDPWEP
jgi:hypothetical protein